MAHSIVTGCIGCGACLRICPVAAISGERKELHRVNHLLCIDCGVCGRVCPKHAVRDGKGLMVERLKKTLWLRPDILIEKCYACENCVDACPAGVLSMKDEELPLEKNYAVLSDPDRCVSCEWCRENCQFDAIVMVPEEERTGRSAS